MVRALPGEPPVGLLTVFVNTGHREQPKLPEPEVGFWLHSALLCPRCVRPTSERCDRGVTGSQWLSPTRTSGPQEVDDDGGPTAWG